MGPSGYVPSRFVYGVDHALQVVKSYLPAQHERMAALETAKREMSTITAGLRIRQALRSKLPPATRYDIQQGIEVLVCRKKEKQWVGPYRVVRVMEKEVYVDWDGEKKHFNLCQVVPMPQTQRDRELKRLLEGMKQFKSDPPPGVS